jgi:hypothetical protein
LDLRLPRASARQARNVVLDDPRVNQARATLKDMIDAAMGDGRWVMERLDGNRQRARNGLKCMELHRSRADQIDPIGASYSPKPWVAKPC